MLSVAVHIPTAVVAGAMADFLWPDDGEVRWTVPTKPEEEAEKRAASVTASSGN